MTITVRLDDNLARELEALARCKGVTKSEVIRECLAEYVAQARHPVTAWELGQELFGKVGSGHGQRARTAKQIVKERLGARHRRG